MTVTDKTTWSQWYIVLYLYKCWERYTITCSYDLLPSPPHSFVSYGCCLSNQNMLREVHQQIMFEIWNSWLYNSRVPINPRNGMDGDSSKCQSWLRPEELLRRWSWWKGSSAPCTELNLGEKFQPVICSRSWLSDLLIVSSRNFMKNIDDQ